MLYPDFYQKIWMGKMAHGRRKREEHFQAKVLQVSDHYPNACKTLETAIGEDS